MSDFILLTRAGTDSEICVSLDEILHIQPYIKNTEIKEFNNDIIIDILYDFDATILKFKNGDGFLIVKEKFVDIVTLLKRS